MGARPVGTPVSSAWFGGCGGCAPCRHSGFVCAVCRPIGLTAFAAASPRSRTLRSRQTAHPPQPPNQADETYAAARTSTHRSPQAEQPKPTQPTDYAPKIYISPSSRNLRSRQTAHPAARSRLRFKESAPLLSRVLCAHTASLILCAYTVVSVHIVHLFRRN